MPKKSKTTNRKPFVFIAFCCLFIVQMALAQQDTSNSAIYQAELNQTISVYKDQIGDQSPLNNGSHYASYNFTFREGTPYYLNGEYGNGSVVYDGIRFDSLSLLYEDLGGVVVVKNGSFLLQLVSERISTFTISGHRFVRISADSSDQNKIKSGFYEILYSGQITLLKKTTKKLVVLAAYNEGANKSIEETDTYYFKLGNVYTAIHSMDDLTAVFGAHAGDVQNYMKVNRLKLKKNTENTLIQVAGYFDQIDR